MLWKRNVLSLVCCSWVVWVAGNVLMSLHYFLTYSSISPSSSSVSLDDVVSPVVL
jgi:hypothetical protein